MNKTIPATPAVIAASFRLLAWNELVRRGDFVEDGRQGFEPWEGPSGFRADSFVKQIYRRLKSAPLEISKAH
jgi:hypothetical protein